MEGGPGAWGGEEAHQLLPLHLVQVEGLEARHDRQVHALAQSLCQGLHLRPRRLEEALPGVGLAHGEGPGAHPVDPARLLHEPLLGQGLEEAVEGALGKPRGRRQGPKPRLA